MDSFSSAANEKKVIVLNAPERIRKIEGNSYCADCCAPSKEDSPNPKPSPKATKRYFKLKLNRTRRGVCQNLACI